LQKNQKILYVTDMFIVIGTSLINCLAATSSTYNGINPSSVFKHLRNSLERTLAGGNGMGAPPVHLRECG